MKLNSPRWGIRSGGQRVGDSKDNLYRSRQPQADFVFDEKVARVFSDMINRSVPGYATIVSMIGMLAERYARADSRCYDLGCSLGAATVAMRQHISFKDCEIIAVDNSIAMISHCRQRIAGDDGMAKVSLVCADVLDVGIINASMVVLNFTLQFIPPARRRELMERIYAGLLPGGMLVLSEKILFEDEGLNELFVDMHHRFKMSHGYSELEISQKRSAIEKVLIPETIATHQQRIAAAGFAGFDVWFQCFNFASMVAVKA